MTRGHGLCDGPVNEKESSIKLVAKYENTKMRKERKEKEVKLLVGALIASHTNQDHLIRLPSLDTRRDITPPLRKSLSAGDSKLQFLKHHYHQPGPQGLPLSQSNLVSSSDSSVDPASENISYKIPSISQMCSVAILDDTKQDFDPIPST